MLQQGMRAPELILPATDHAASVPLLEPSSRIVLLFLPARPSESLRNQFAQYQAQATAFHELDTRLIAVTDAPAESLEQWAGELQLSFLLVSDPERQNWRAYAQASPEQSVEPATFVIDEERRIRAVFDSTRYPNLPGPRSIIRAIRQLDDMLKPAPISEQDWRIGPLDAPVTLIEYSDYQCHHCIALHQILRQIKAEYGERLLVIHRHLPLRATHPLAEKAAQAAEAAGAQGKFWAMHDRLFTAAGALDRSHLTAYAEELGLDLEQFVGDLDSSRHQEAVNQDSRLATQNGIKLPPTLFINGILFEGPRTEDSLRQRIASLLPPNQK